MKLELLAADRWTLDALLDLAPIGDVQISPDGPSNRYHSSIWIAGAEAHLKIEGGGSDSHPRWTPDSKSLAFLSRSSGITQIHLFDATRTIRKVTNSPTAITSFKWAPGGKQLGYLAVDPLTQEERERIRAGDDPIVVETNYKYSRVYSVDGGLSSPVIGKGGRVYVLANDILWVFPGSTTPWGDDEVRTACDTLAPA